MSNLIKASLKICVKHTIETIEQVKHTLQSTCLDQVFSVSQPQASGLLTLPTLPLRPCPAIPLRSCPTTPHPISPNTKGLYGNPP